MIPTDLREFVHDLLASTEMGSLKWERMPNKGYSVTSNDVLLILNEGDMTEFYPRLISLSACVGEDEANFKVFEDEIDYRFMTELVAAVQVNAGDMRTKLKSVFA